MDLDSLLIGIAIGAGFTAGVTALYGYFGYKLLDTWRYRRGAKSLPPPEVPLRGEDITIMKRDPFSEFKQIDTRPN